MSLFTRALRGHVRDAEAAIVTLNRQAAEAMACGRPADELLAQIRAISESRNFILARLRRLEGSETQGCAPSTTETAPLEDSPQSRHP
jgi:hypothetical protein